MILIICNQEVLLVLKCDKNILVKCNSAQCETHAASTELPILPTTTSQSNQSSTQTFTIFPTCPQAAAVASRNPSVHLNNLTRERELPVIFRGSVGNRCTVVSHSV